MTRSRVTSHPPSCGLYYGAPAVAFALHAAGHPSYASALDRLDAHVAVLTRDRLDRAHERIDRNEFPELREFDLIRGLTGLGVYLLQRHRDDDLLRDVITYLVRLTEPLTVDGAELPGWWCPAAPGKQPSHRWPGGHSNLGLSHGISGPLAVLALAQRQGATVRGQTDAIARICHELDHWRTGTGTRAWWPGTVSRSEWQAGTVRLPGPGRPSWCYGTPGLARAQQLAADALGDPVRQRQAEQALVGCIGDDSQLAKLSDASLCHGWAGVIRTTWRMGTHPGADETLTGRVPYLMARLSRHLHEYGPPHDDGLLEGTAGVELVQLTAPRAPTGPSWDACLLLNPEFHIPPGRRRDPRGTTDNVPEGDR